MKHDQSGPDEMPCDDGHERYSEDKFLPTRAENMNLLQAIWTCNFWLLFLAMACGMGSGLATVNNIGQIGGSLGYTSTETSTLVSLSSNMEFSGSFWCWLHLGLLPSAERLCKAPVYSCNTCNHERRSCNNIFWLSWFFTSGFYTGWCGLWFTMGLRHFGTIFNTVAIASPFGSYILSVRVVGYIYDMESSSSSAGVQECMGKHCFMLSFLIMASVTFFGVAVALALLYRTRRFYKQVVYARLQTSFVE